MDRQLKEKYGLITAIAMVVGIVIGSGVFFKAEKVLSATGGDLPLGILAWALGGAIMVICAYTFSVMATRYSHINGIVDYAEATVGKGYAYFMGWFATFIYYPAMTSVLAWVSARYVGVLLGLDIAGGPVMVLAGLFLVGSYAVNALSPILAGKFQVATTIIKLVPLLLMAVVGTIVGLGNGMTVQNFVTVVEPVAQGKGMALFTALVATAFAYEGWIIATSINAELKNSKRNLPIALVLGTLIVAAVYILYYIGLAGGATNAEMTAFFARHYATDYPEPEAILAASLAGYRVGEAPVVMHERLGGVSSISAVKSVYYMVKVSLSLVIDRLAIKRSRRGK